MYITEKYINMFQVNLKTEKLIAIDDLLAGI